MDTLRVLVNEIFLETFFWKRKKKLIFFLWFFIFLMKVVSKLYLNSLLAIVLNAPVNNTLKRKRKKDHLYLTSIEAP